MAKSKYESHVLPNLELIKNWCMDGDTDKTIAEKLHISQESFYKYKREFPEFSDVLKEGKEIIDYQVENKLLQRAMGYTYTEVRIDKDENGKETRRTETVKEVVPDTTAQIFWLKNRKQQQWRDKQEINSTNKTIIKFSSEDEALL